MQDRELFEARVEAELQKIESELALARNNLDQASMNIRLRGADVFDDLVREHKEVKVKFQALKDATGDNYEEMKNNVAEALKELDRKWERARNQLG